jgi:hypothetical protein
MRRPDGHLHLPRLSPCDVQALIAVLCAHALPR